MRFFLTLLIVAATACAAKTPAPQPAPQPQPQPPPVAPVVVEVQLSKDVLVTFVSEQFPEAVAAGLVTLDFGVGVEDDLLAELATMDIRTVAQLAAIVPSDFKTRGFGAMQAVNTTTTIAGLIRDLMIIHDARGYFTKAWNNSWTSMGPEDFPAPAAYGVDFALMYDLGVFGGQ